VDRRRASNAGKAESDTDSRTDLHVTLPSWVRSTASDIETVSEVTSDFPSVGYSREVVVGIPKEKSGDSACTDAGSETETKACCGEAARDSVSVDVNTVGRRYRENESNVGCNSGVDRVGFTRRLQQARL